MYHAPSSTSSTLSSSPRASLVRRVFAWALVALAAGTTPLACGDDSGTAATSGGECQGGVVVNGVCEGKCTPDKCIEDNTCVQNRCLLKCSHLDDCYNGDPTHPDQDCRAAKEDDTDADILVCQTSGKAPFGTKCPFGSECDGILACPDGGACDYAQCGGAPCEKDEFACEGIDNCSVGLCPDGATACVVPGCPADQCKPLACITTGEGDTNAYCTLQDCTTDANCARGFQCAITHDPREICNTTKGNNNFCGTTGDPCVDPADFASNGGTFQEGSVCLLRNTCTPRKQCDPCADDIDCSYLEQGKCTQVGPDKRCTKACGTDKDCTPGYACDPTEKQCIPRAGSCVGDGSFCQPCTNDTDCGDGSGTDGAWACVEESTGERGCFDLSFPDACTTDNDCPVGPSGKHGHCFGTNPNDNSSPGDGVYHTCYLTWNFVNFKFGCWY
jgi:hypothetical protein